MSPWTFLSQRSRRQAHPRSAGGSFAESGQAFIEYILLLVVIIAILLSLMWRLSSAYKAWTTNLFGNYFACLLETGELPGSATSVCAAEWQSFDINKGTMKARVPGGGGAAGPGSSSSADARARDAARRRAAAARARGSGGGGSSREAAGGGGRGRSFAGRIGSRVGSQVAGQVAEGDKKSSSLSLLRTPSRGRSFSGQVQGQGQRLSYSFTIDGDGVRTVASEEPQQAGSIDKQEAGIYALKRERFTTPAVPPKRKSEIKDEPMDFSLGFILRILLIAAICIALFVFIGGQIASFSKSLQKRSD